MSEGAGREVHGSAVECTVCGLRKKPRGRSGPLVMANSLCDYECPGYDKEPFVGDLWPGESREEFGYGATGSISGTRTGADDE
jgi:hypothetical protein